ncbi:MAG: hypothetical protein IJ840_07815 [Bacteroidales bacterium]|nr:hypothetical protein [Bacteroidales bacterium]
MDIDLFSDIVKDLVLDNDEVTLPGLGTFVSELMPSSFSDKGYTINPPYRRLSFRQRWQEGDTLLVDFYSRTNGIDKSQAAGIVGEFISGLKETLQSRKLVVLPGLGRLRATRENAFFFIADEDLDIYPYGFGLEPVSLKTHEETPEEVSAVVNDLQDALSDDVVVKAPVRRNKWLVAVLCAVASVILFLGLFMAFARIAPDLVDKILYSEEELRIINY